MKNTALAGTALAGTASWESYIGSDRIDIKVYVGVRQDIRRCVPDAGFSMLVFMGYEQHFANAFCCLGM